MHAQLRFWMIAGGAAWTVVAIALFRRVVPRVESRVLTRLGGARAFLGALMGVGLLAVVVWVTARLDPLPKAAVSLAVHAGMAAFLVALAGAVEPGRDVLGLGVSRLPDDFVRGVGAYVVFIPSVVAAHVLNDWFVGEDARSSVQEKFREALVQVGPGRVLVILNLVFAVPLFEEIVFRGLLQQGIKAQLSVVAPAPRARIASILLASVGFTALHPPATYLPVFALSLLLGAAYEKSGRLLVPVALHGAHNLAVVLYDSLPRTWGTAP